MAEILEMKAGNNTTLSVDNFFILHRRYFLPTSMIVSGFFLFSSFFSLLDIAGYLLILRSVFFVLSTLAFISYLTSDWTTLTFNLTLSIFRIGWLLWHIFTTDGFSVIFETLPILVFYAIIIIEFTKYRGLFLQRKTNSIGTGNMSVVKKVFTFAVYPIIGALVVVFASAYGQADSDLKMMTAAYIDAQNQIDELSALSENTAASAQKKYYTLENGNFVAGKDFPAGTYDIKAVSGVGNVFSDNMFSGGINAIMGIKNDDTFGIAQPVYSNIALPDGTTLTISNVKIRLELIE